VLIVVLCPYCDTKFTLQADMNGKSMRCPNLECRQVFTVKAREATAPPPALPPEPVHAPPPPPPKPAASAPPKPSKPPTKPAPAFEVVDAVVVEAAVVSPPKVKEVVWTEGTDVPPPPGAGGKKEPPKKPAKPLKPQLAETADDDPAPARKKKKRNRRPLLIAGMLVLSVAAVGFAVFYIVYYQQKQEEKLAKQAEDEYAKGSYGDAAKNFDKLTKEYASSKNIDKYKFFADLAGMQTVVRGVTNREDYDAAVKRLNDFVQAQKDSPFAKPTTGFGRDVLEAGKKLGEDIAAHADDRVKAFQGDRAKKGGELERADKAIKVGRELIPVLDPFRAADDPPLEKLKNAYDQVEKGVKRERDRTAAINKARDKLSEPTDAIIQGVEADLAAANLATDAEAIKLVAEAKGRLRDLVRYEDDPADPQPPPPTSAASLLFVTPVGETKARDPAPGDPPPGVFLCVARGVLYAFDEDRGTLLWAARVGQDVTDPPALARVELATGPTDLAVVVSNVGGAPAVAGQVLRTGAVRWYQPLPAPAAGPAVVVGNRAFVALRDALGTVYEFELSTGARVGKIRLGQTVADRGAVLRPGTGYLYVAADARRVYVIEAAALDPAGNRENPRCVQVVATGHLPGTLRCAPLFIGPEGTEPAPRWMVLAQTEGTAKTLLRVFAVAPISAPAGPGASVPETLADDALKPPLVVPGWVSFAPVCNGEHLAVISDTGAFRLFGVQQPGNSDKALFPYPAPPAPPLDRPVPGLVIPVEESAYWLAAAGQLQKARLAVTTSAQEVVFTGSPLPAGEPVHAAQVNTRRDTACLVVRALNSSGCRAIAFDLRTGAVRWQRQLGLVPAKLSSTDQVAPPIVQGDRFILVDEEGGIVAVPVASAARAGETLAAPESWVLEPAPANVTGPTVVAASADGKVVFAITPVDRGGPKFVVRRVTDGKVTHKSEVNAPAALAGQPAVVGADLLVPTADGFVNRFVHGDGLGRASSLVAGPPWRGDRRVENATCAITPLSAGAFATSNGTKYLSRWDWPAGGKWNPSGAWELRDVVAGPGVVVPPAEPGGPARLLVAEASGNVWLCAADRAAVLTKPKWRPGAPSAIPAGRPTGGVAAQPGAPAGTVAAYAIDGKTVAGVDPDRDDALWAARTNDLAPGLLVGAPQPAGANRWVLTDLSGRVVVLDGATGHVLAAQTVGLQGAVPAAASSAAGDRALTPLADGSAVFVELSNR